MSTEHDRGAEAVTEDDRWYIEISKNGVDETNLFYFRPDDICRTKEWGSIRKWGVGKRHIPR
jgi:hypothetical protein